VVSQTALVPETARLLRATAANHRAWFRRNAAVAGGGVERVDGVEVIVADGDGAIAFPLAEAIGFGDLDRLAALQPTEQELEQVGAAPGSAAARRAPFLNLRP
jgi:hypothetical protein